MAKFGAFLYGQAKYGTGGVGSPPPSGTGDPIGWTATGGGNHGGEDWLIDANLEVGGVHRNVGKFRIAPNVLVRVVAYDGAGFGTFEVDGKHLIIAGALVASLAGYRGGVPSAAGEGPFGGAPGVDGGYLTGAGQGDATTDTSGVKGSGGGGGAASVGGSGGGLIRLFASWGLAVEATGIVYAHGDPEGAADAGHGAGGGIVLHCRGPLGVSIAGIVRTLGGGSLTATGGSLKEFAQASKLAVGGTTSAGRTYQNTTLTRAVVG